MYLGKHSPWGRIEFEEKIADGIYNVSTPGHGGLKLDAARNRRVNPVWRRAGGWYEEDCEWAIVALTFPDEVFPEPESQDRAHKYGKHWFPDEYSKVTGTEVLVEESLVLHQRAFDERTKDKFVGVAAFGSWEKSVPEGMVGVVLRHQGTGVEKNVLVTQDAYDKRGPGKYVATGEESAWVRA